MEMALCNMCIKRLNRRLTEDPKNLTRILKRLKKGKKVKL